MNTHKNAISKQEIINEICYQIGFATWQLQDLERNLAYYYVLVLNSNEGMGFENAKVPLEKSLKKPLGQSLDSLNNANLIPTEFKKRFQSLLDERNWLVHRSRADNRNIFDSRLVYESFLNRMQLIKNETLSLSNIVEKFVSTYLEQQNFIIDNVDELTQEILDGWHMVQDSK